VSRGEGEESVNSTGGEGETNEERVKERKLVEKGEGYRPLFLDKEVGGSLGSTEGEGGADKGGLEGQKLLLE
jgi:hypothetical protein